MLTKFELRIEQRHIDNGVSCDCECCPAALAFKEQFPQIKIHAVTGRYLTYWLANGGPRFCRFPVALHDAIRKFDIKGVMKPGTYELALETE